MLNFDREAMVQDYVEGMPSWEICNKYGISRGLIHFEVKKRNLLKSKSERSRKYNLDNNYFAEINSQQKAYWLGFIAADGSMNLNKTGTLRSLSFHLSSLDRDLLVRFTEDIQFTGPLYDLKNGNVSVNISGNEFLQNLVNLGITPNKTFTIVYPDINPQYDSAFILGVLDGDGCFSLHNKNQPTPQARMTLVSASHGFLETINEKLKRVTGKPNKVITKDRNHYVLSYNGNKSCTLLYKYLYSDPPEFFLTRKQYKVSFLKEGV